MTTITDQFRWDGPANGAGNDPAIDLSWEQSKAVVEELNRRESERMAAFAKDALTVGAPEGVDIGGIAILSGVSSAFISAGPRDEVPRILENFILLIIERIVPANMKGPYLMSIALKAMNAGQDQSPPDQPVDDETADEITKTLNRLRKAGLN
jgi:hypothetical protein